MRPIYPYEKISEVCNRVLYYYKTQMHNDGWSITVCTNKHKNRYFRFNDIYNYSTPHGETVKKQNTSFQILIHFHGTSKQFHLARQSGEYNYKCALMKAKQHGFITNEDGIIIDFDEKAFNDTIHIWQAQEMGLL